MLVQLTIFFSFLEDPPLEYVSDVFGVYVYPEWAFLVGWSFALVPMALVIIVITYKFIIYGGSFKQVFSAQNKINVLYSYSICLHFSACCIVDIPRMGTFSNKKQPTRETIQTKALATTLNVNSKRPKLMTEKTYLFFSLVSSLFILSMVILPI